MPKIRRQKLPQPLLSHLLARMRQRHITATQIVLLSRWLDTDPDVPEGKGFKSFPDFVRCVEGELIKTFFLPGQAPDRQEIE